MVYNDWNNDYLAHHGIKGMHWGIRRFQNPDGTLTSAGKERYSEDGGGIRESSNKPIAAPTTRSTSGANINKGVVNAANGGGGIRESSNKPIATPTTRSTSGANINKGVVNAANGTGAEKYDKKKYNLKNFDEWPEGRKKALKAGLIAGGAMIVSAGVTYAVVKTNMKKYDGRSDITIPKGDPLFRTEFGDSQGLDNDTFFATPNQADNFAYMGHYAARTGYNAKIAEARDGVLNRTINASRDVKVAGSDSAINMLIANKSLLTGEFRDDLDRVDKASYLSPEFKKEKVKSLFNEWLRGASMSESGMCDGVIAYGDDRENWKTFKHLLKIHGYDGVVDTNDMYGAGGGGIGTKQPMIFVNNRDTDNDANFEYSSSGDKKYNGAELAVLGRLAQIKTFKTIGDRMNWGGDAQQVGMKAATTILGAGLTAVRAVNYYDQYREKKDRIAENKAQKEAKKAATAEKVNASRADITKAIDYGMSSAAIAKRFDIPVSEVKALREQLKEEDN